MSEVKAGDRVWVSGEITGRHADGFFVGAGRWRELLPDSPSLPAVARFLAESPQVGHELSAALDLIDDHVEIAMPAPCMSRLRALVAALATDAADGGAGRAETVQDATEGAQ